MSIQLSIQIMNKKAKVREGAYPIKQIRMKQATWESLKNLKIQSGLTWNLFILKLIKKK